MVDYGAGTGLLTLNLQPRVGSILALDSSRGMLEQLTQKLAATGINSVQTRQWDLEAEPYPDRGFDLVASSMTLHHLRDVPLVLKRLAALLKPGGWLAADDLEREDGSFHGERDDAFHLGFERNDVSAWLAEAGFGWVSISDAHSLLKPGPTGQMLTYGVFLVAGQKKHG